MLTRVFLSLLLTVCAASAPLAPPPADYSDTGPLGLLITYRSAPVDRPAFRDYLQQQALPRLEGWRREGWLEEYRIFYNWYVDAGTWDAALMLRFREYADVARWKQVEMTMPGGLCAAGHRLARPHMTHSTDCVWHNPGEEKGTDPAERVTLLIPYKYLGLVQEYKDYVKGYVLPQLDGWVREKALASYRILLNRFPTGDRWKSMLVLEYRNLEAFGKRKQVKLKVRAGLRRDPVWVDWSKRKRTIRTELEPIITDRVLPVGR